MGTTACAARVYVQSKPGTNIYCAFGPTLAASTSSCANRLKQPKSRHSSRTLLESADTAVEDIQVCKVTQSPRYKINNIEPHEAVPEVSRSKVHITQNKHVPIEWFVTTASQSRI